MPSKRCSQRPSRLFAEKNSSFQDQILLTNVSFSLTPSANITNVTGGGEVLLAVVVAHPTATDTLGSNGK